ncbi:MAG TPA: PrsW family glutamic-type intramembrane protease [Kouleothrix sp.]|uniref:PrsW family intramembrane metalloprotease n=1 Tax=Kouleothrix sp. TaxID=2779161 RepID=UPI002BEA0FB0|nr:PrsW family glutamic-type intramembrane protease [Kouleothrix sp.]HRC75633.1 PrsW family glutamic-type intramembrane protease [Kouleothrix sp.]
MDEQVRCCICGDPVQPPYNILGRRAYCERHFALVNKPNVGFWRAGMFQIVLMGLFSAIVALLASNLGQVSHTALIAIGLFLAIVPSALWLVFFYRQDRLEPEPKTMIAQVFLLALVLTDVVGIRVFNDWFELARWAPAETLTSLLADTLVVGFTVAAIVYVAVRLVVYTTPEFDERMDGIVYGTVAGLGVATLLNLHYVIDNNGVALGPGTIHVVTTALAQASFGGLLGYFMAQAKFEHRPAWWVPLGLAVAAILNGVFTWLMSEISASGLTVQPWRSLALGVALALAVFGVLLALMRRAMQATLAQAAG